MVNRLTRIVGGQETEVNEYPWHVGLVSPGDVTPWCGGSIITRRHVLTAAHCTIDSSTGTVKIASSINVLVGDHNTTDSVVEVRAVAGILNHPSFNFNTGDHDVSVLTLLSSLTFSSVAGPVCLPGSASSLYTGQLATVTGWGDTSSDGGQASTLQEVEVTVVSNQECRNAYGDNKIKE